MKLSSIRITPLNNKMKYSSAALGCAIMVLILVVSTSEATLSCSDVIKDLRPCISYLVSGSGKPPEACCSGAKALASSATTSEDKKAACNCIKSSAKSISLNSELAQALPRNCGIPLSLTISPNADCSKLG